MTHRVTIVFATKHSKFVLEDVSSWSWIDDRLHVTLHSGERHFFPTANITQVVCKELK